MPEAAAPPAAVVAPALALKNIPAAGDPAPEIPAVPRSDPPETAAAQAASQMQLAADPAEAEDRTPIERLAIPGLKVDVQVQLKPRKDNTWDISGLRADVAWLEGTAHPAAVGNTVLAGHIMVRGIGKGPFRYLDRLENGASVLVYTARNLYIYQVRAQALVKETDGQVTLDTANPQLTLLTCASWDESVEQYQRRRAVFADLVKVEPLPAAGALSGEAGQ